MNDKQLTCEDRIEKQLKGRLEDLDEDKNEEFLSGDYGALFSEYLEGYGLSFDYVAPDTFKAQESGYFRWQLSWGGPSDEFRFYPQDDTIRYHFMDWFDGAGRTLTREQGYIVIEAVQQIDPRLYDFDTVNFMDFDLRFWARLRQMETRELDKIDREELAFSHA